MLFPIYYLPQKLYLPFLMQLKQINFSIFLPIQADLFQIDLLPNLRLLILNLNKLLNIIGIDSLSLYALNTKPQRKS